MDDNEKREAVERFLDAHADFEFTDAQMAELFAEEKLKGGFAWTKEVGWFRWDGRRWGAVADPVILGVARKWILDRYREASNFLAMALEAGMSGGPARNVRAYKRIFCVISLAGIWAPWPACQSLMLCNHSRISIPGPTC
jgi:hypothetical protein